MNIKKFEDAKNKIVEGLKELDQLFDYEYINDDINNYPFNNCIRDVISDVEKMTLNDNLNVLMWDKEPLDRDPDRQIYIPSDVAFSIIGAKCNAYTVKQYGRIILHGKKTASGWEYLPITEI